MLSSTDTKLALLSVCLLKLQAATLEAGVRAKITKKLWTVLESWVGASQLACACALVAVGDSGLEDKFRLIFELLSSYNSSGKRVTDTALVAFLKVSWLSAAVDCSLLCVAACG